MDINVIYFLVMEVVHMHHIRIIQVWYWKKIRRSMMIHRYQLNNRQKTMRNHRMHHRLYFVSKNLFEQIIRKNHFDSI